MICTFTSDGFTTNLAGGAGIASETSGLRITPSPSFTQAAYIGATYGVQWPAPGAWCNVSFESRITFPSSTDAERYILALPGYFCSQASTAIAIIGHNYGGGTGVLQVETATCAGTCTGDGMVKITVTSALFTPAEVVTVTIANGDTAAQWAAKVRSAMLTQAQVTLTHYTIGGTGADIVLTSRFPLDNHSLNVAIEADTATGITDAPTSANTTPGFANLPYPARTLYNASANISASQIGATVLLDVNLMGRLTSP